MQACNESIAQVTHDTESNWFVIDENHIIRRQHDKDCRRERERRWRRHGHPLSAGVFLVINFFALRSKWNLSKITRQLHFSWRRRWLFVSSVTPHTHRVESSVVVSGSGSSTLVGNLPPTVGGDCVSQQSCAPNITYSHALCIIIIHKT